MDDNSRPIFIQLAERLENDIVMGTINEQSQIPSINELALFHRINPATALKAVNQLVDNGLLFKKRGIGMFVASGAREQLLAKHNQQFVDDYIEPMKKEARKLGITKEQLIEMLGESI